MENVKGHLVNILKLFNGISIMGIFLGCASLTSFRMNLEPGERLKRIAILQIFVHDESESSIDLKLDYKLLHKELMAYAKEKYDLEGPSWEEIEKIPLFDPLRPKSGFMDTIFRTSYELGYPVENKFSLSKSLRTEVMKALNVDALVFIRIEPKYRHQGPSLQDTILASEITSFKLSLGAVNDRAYRYFWTNNETFDYQATEYRLDYLKKSKKNPFSGSVIVKDAFSTNTKNSFQTSLLNQLKVLIRTKK